MPTFLYRLTPPRPDFPAGMTPAEGAAMQAHFGYWGAQMQQGQVSVVGPVLDPAGTHGIAVLTAGSEDEAKRIANADPVLQANLGFRGDVFAMPDALVKGA